MFVQEIFAQEKYNGHHKESITFLGGLKGLCLCLFVAGLWPQRKLVEKMQSTTIAVEMDALIQGLV